MILDKLPQRVRWQLYMQKPDDQEWTTSSLRQLLGKYISAMEMVEETVRLPRDQVPRQVIPFLDPACPNIDQQKDF